MQAAFVSDGIVVEEWCACMVCVVCVVCVVCGVWCMVFGECGVR